MELSLSEIECPGQIDGTCGEGTLEVERDVPKVVPRGVPSAVVLRPGVTGAVGGRTGWEECGSRQQCFFSKVIVPTSLFPNL